MLFPFCLQDKAYLAQKLNLPIEDLDLKANVREGQPTNEVARNWFKELTRIQVRGLFELYQPDFELFGYDLEPYYSIAKPDI